ncbi:three-helix bundle dimerization domain-containing protein [Arthrobacter bambusae]|uniref:three-helix bundle dimerization domain-containing protein n=1 Tax=Arthrobacter bambusae TaxID=1338426 RepID=UPI002784DAE9|nr:hypothetical protein [Arthrobacter bambusae]
MREYVGAGIPLLSGSPPGISRPIFAGLAGSLTHSTNVVILLTSARSGWTISPMTREDEARALVAVITNLAERFPTIPRADIETVVAEEHSNLNNGPIWDYVPLLVEHAAKKRLKKTGTKIQVSDDSSSVLVGNQPTNAN